MRPGRLSAALAWLGLGLAQGACGQGPSDSPPSSASAQPFDLSHGRLDALLGRVVDERGLVDYASLVADRAALDAHLADLAAVDRATFDSWAPEDQLAFLINAYNACTLALVADHWPVASIRDIAPDPWEHFTFPLLGEEWTLNQIEHGLIRPVFHEPRVHFALVCAAVSCPPLLPRAYRGEDLDEVLEANTRAFLLDPERNDLSDLGHLHLSRIFEWYASDFEGSAGSVAQFVSDHTGLDIPSGAVIDFLPYSWALNTQ